MRGGRCEWVLVCCLLLGGARCDRNALANPETPSSEATNAPQASSKTAESERPRTPEAELQAGLVLGEFALAEKPVIDGDTIRVKGIEDSIRLLGLDTEEKTKTPKQRQAIKADFRRYARLQRGNSQRPVRFGTPMGDEATAFAEDFFRDAEVVRLERDDPKSVHGRFGRALAYVFVQKDGRWTSYNVEAVRAGMSPYFTKYGYSRRFHGQFARAEVEAREARRGIWDPTKKHYPDYDERKAWWNARADFIQAFEHAGTGRDDHIMLSQIDSQSRLEAHLGREVMVLSNVVEIQRFKGLIRVFLAGPDRQDFPIIFRDYGVFRESGMEDATNDPVTVRGTVERYTKGRYDTLQIVVTRPDQVAAL